MVEGTPPLPPPTSTHLHQPPPSSTNLLRPPPALFAMAFFYLIRLPETLIILRAQQLGIALAYVPLLWAAVHVVKSSSSFIGGALADRVGPSARLVRRWASIIECS